MQNNLKNTSLDLSREFESPTLESWKSLVEKTLKGASFETALESRTYDDIRIDPLYPPVRSAADGPNASGKLSFDREVFLQARETDWDIRQIVALPSAEQCRHAINQDVQGGANSIQLKVAGSSQSGVPITAVHDLETIFKDVETDRVPIYLDAGSNIWQVSSYFVEYLNKLEANPERIRCGFNIDPLGTLSEAGGLLLNLDQTAEKLSAMVSEFSSTWPNIKIFTVRGRPYHNSGASEAQEISAIAATFVTYLRWLEDRGISPSVSVKHATLGVSVNSDFFLSIAKIRALKAVISRIADACGIAEQAMLVPIDAQSSEPMMTSRDIYVNLLRTTASCAAAAIGGASSISLVPFTWPAKIEDDFARRMARTTQLVLQKEAGLAQVRDAPGGSGYIDTLTDELAKKSWTDFQAIEASGGMVNALQNGTIQKQIRKIARARYDNIASGIEEITGVTAYPYLYPEAGEEKQNQLIDTESEEEAVTVEPLPLRRFSEPFEKLRTAADEATEKLGYRPTVFVVTIGKKSDHADRLSYAINFFATAGLDCCQYQLGTDIGQLETAFNEKEYKITCVCGADQDYENHSLKIIRALKSAGATRIYQVGRPGELRKRYRDAGCDDFLYPGCSMLQILNSAIGSVFRRINVDFV